MGRPVAFRGGAGGGASKRGRWGPCRQAGGRWRMLSRLIMRPPQGWGGRSRVQGRATQRAPRERETPRRTVLTEVRRLAARKGASSQRALVRGTVRWRIASACAGTAALASPRAAMRQRITKKAATASQTRGIRTKSMSGGLAPADGAVFNRGGRGGPLAYSDRRRGGFSAGTQRPTDVERRGAVGGAYSMSGWGVMSVGMRWSIRLELCQGRL